MNLSKPQTKPTWPPPTAKVAEPAKRQALSREKVAERAYQIWQANGCREGHRDEHWYQAEQELRGS